MTKLRLAFILVLTTIASALATETCSAVDTLLYLQSGQCYAEGYVCNLSTDINGGVRFNVGLDSLCNSLERTSFVSYPPMDGGELDITKPDSVLRPLLVEDASLGVDALAVVVNTAFLINAFNEKFKVGVIYYRSNYAIQDRNSVRFVGSFALYR